MEDVGASGNIDSQELRDRLDNSGGVVRCGQVSVVGRPLRDED